MAGRTSQDGARAGRSASGTSGRAVRGICLGLGATLIVAAIHWSPLGQLAEVQWLDVCFQYLPTLHAGGQIVHVDLDDKALEHVGRWPWPRRRLAQLAEVLTECGARAVALDIILPYPQKPRYVKEGATDLYAADTSAVMSAAAPPIMVLDDVELASALGGSADLFLAMRL